MGVKSGIFSDSIWANVHRLTTEFSHPMNQASTAGVYRKTSNKPKPATTYKTLVKSQLQPSTATTD